MNIANKKSAIVASAVALLFMFKYLNPSVLRIHWQGLTLINYRNAFCIDCSELIYKATSKQTNTCSKLTIEVLEKGVKYVQS